VRKPLRPCAAIVQEGFEALMAAQERELAEKTAAVTYVEVAGKRESERERGESERESACC
jgi:hypothetical protein